MAIALSKVMIHLIEQFLNTHLPMAAAGTHVEDVGFFRFCKLHRDHFFDGPNIIHSPQNKINYSVMEFRPL